MKIPLKNFEKYLTDYNILWRWKDYFQNNKVYKLKECKNFLFEAEVIGSENYEVSVKLDVDNNIMALYCDCPYDYWPICKHEIALLHKLREKFIEEKILVIKENKKKKVSGISKKENTKAFFRWIIKESINWVSKGRWYIEWDRVDEALYWANNVICKIDDLLAQKDFKTAILALSILIETLIISLQDVDDSSWDYWSMIEIECIEEYLTKLIKYTKEYWNKKEIDTLILEFLKLVQNSKISWFDFERQIFNTLMEWLNKENYKHFRKALDFIKNKDSFNTYEIIEYRMIQTIWTSDEINKFIKENLKSYSFAMIVVEEYIEKNKFEKATTILENHLKKREYCKLEIFEKLLKISRLTKNKNDEKKYLFEIFSENSTISNFNEYKKFLWKDKYKIDKQKIFDKIDNLKKISNSREYPDICLQEKEEKRFLEYIFRNPYIYIVDRFFTKLLKIIPDELYNIYKNEVEEHLIQTTNRKKYAEQCRKIRKMKKIFPDETMNFIEKLKSKYYQRSALKEELDLV